MKYNYGLIQPFTIFSSVRIILLYSLFSLFTGIILRHNDLEVLILPQYNVHNINTKKLKTFFTTILFNNIRLFNFLIQVLLRIGIYLLNPNNKEFKKFLEQVDKGFLFYLNWSSIFGRFALDFFYFSVFEHYSFLKGLPIFIIAVTLNFIKFVVEAIIYMFTTELTTESNLDQFLDTPTQLTRKIGSLFFEKVENWRDYFKYLGPFLYLPDSLLKSLPLFLLTLRLTPIMSKYILSYWIFSNFKNILNYIEKRFDLPDLISEFKNYFYTLIGDLLRTIISTSTYTILTILSPWKLIFIIIGYILQIVIFIFDIVFNIIYHTIFSDVENSTVGEKSNSMFNSSIFDSWKEDNVHMYVKQIFEFFANICDLFNILPNVVKLFNTLDFLKMIMSILFLIGIFIAIKVSLNYVSTSQIEAYIAYYRNLLKIYILHLKRIFTNYSSFEVYNQNNPLYTQNQQNLYFIQYLAKGNNGSFTLLPPAQAIRTRTYYLGKTDYFRFLPVDFDGSQLLYNLFKFIFPITTPDNIIQTFLRYEANHEFYQDNFEFINQNINNFKTPDEITITNYPIPRTPSYYFISFYIGMFRYVLKGFICGVPNVLLRIFKLILDKMFNNSDLLYQQLVMIVQENPILIIFDVCISLANNSFNSLDISALFKRLIFTPFQAIWTFINIAQPVDQSITAILFTNFLLSICISIALLPFLTFYGFIFFPVQDIGSVFSQFTKILLYIFDISKIYSLYNKYYGYIVVTFTLATIILVVLVLLNAILYGSIKSLFKYVGVSIAEIFSILLFGYIVIIFIWLGVTLLVFSFAVYQYFSEFFVYFIMPLICYILLKMLTHNFVKLQDETKNLIDDNLLKTAITRIIYKNELEFVTGVNSADSRYLISKAQNNLKFIGLMDSIFPFFTPAFLDLERIKEILTTLNDVDRDEITDVTETQIRNEKFTKEFSKLLIYKNKFYLYFTIFSAIFSLINVYAIFIFICSLSDYQISSKLLTYVHTEIENVNIENKYFDTSINFIKTSILQFFNNLKNTRKNWGNLIGFIVLVILCILDIPQTLLRNPFIIAVTSAGASHVISGRGLFSLFRNFIFTPSVFTGTMLVISLAMIYNYLSTVFSLGIFGICKFIFLKPFEIIWFLLKLPIPFILSKVYGVLPIFLKKIIVEKNIDINNIFYYIRASLFYLPSFVYYDLLKLYRILSSLVTGYFKLLFKNPEIKALWFLLRFTIYKAKSGILNFIKSIVRFINSMFLKSKFLNYSLIPSSLESDMDNILENVKNNLTNDADLTSYWYSKQSVNNVLVNHLFYNMSQIREINSQYEILSVYYPKLKDLSLQKIYSDFTINATVKDLYSKALICNNPEQAEKIISVLLENEQYKTTIECIKLGLVAIDNLNKDVKIKRKIKQRMLDCVLTHKQSKFSNSLFKLALEDLCEIAIHLNEPNITNSKYKTLETNSEYKIYMRKSEKINKPEAIILPHIKRILLKTPTRNIKQLFNYQIDRQIESITYQTSSYMHHSIDMNIILCDNVSIKESSDVVYKTIWNETNKFRTLISTAIISDYIDTAQNYISTIFKNTIDLKEDLVKYKQNAKSIFSNKVNKQITYLETTINKIEDSIDSVIYKLNKTEFDSFTDLFIAIDTINKLFHTLSSLLYKLDKQWYYLNKKCLNHARMLYKRHRSYNTAGFLERLSLYFSIKFMDVKYVPFIFDYCSTNENTAANINSTIDNLYDLLLSGPINIEIVKNISLIPAFEKLNSMKIFNSKYLSIQATEEFESCMNILFEKLNSFVKF